MFELLFDDVTDFQQDRDFDDFDLDEWSEIDDSEPMSALGPVLYEEVWTNPYSNL